MVVVDGTQFPKMRCFGGRHLHEGRGKGCVLWGKQLSEGAAGASLC